MAARDNPPAEDRVLDYRHRGATRKNIPPAGLAAQGRIAEAPKLHYSYDPHLPPVLRFDASGGADACSELLEVAKHAAAGRWVSAVDNWGRLGRWAFHVGRDPQMLGKELAHL